MFMCERLVCSQALPLYQGSMSPVDRMGRSVSNTGSSVRAFSNRIASQMCCTILVMFRVMTILLRLSSSLNSGGIDHYPSALNVTLDQTNQLGKKVFPAPLPRGSHQV